MDDIKETDKINYDDNDKSLHAKIRRSLPNDGDAYEMVATLLGMSGVMLEFISDKTPVNEIPIMVRYACANVAANLVAFTSDGEKRKFVKMPKDPEYEMGEQTQERIYRKMKYIIECLYLQMKEEEI